jgi:hypothetical protein
MCKDDKARRITVVNLKLIQTKIIQLVKLASNVNAVPPREK